MAQQQRQARQRRMIQAGVLVAVVVIIAAIALAVQHGSGSSAPATPTPAPSNTAVPTLPAGPMPAAAEVASSRTACAPFLSAGRQPKGNHQWGMPPKLVIDPAKHYQVKIYTNKGVITADILPKLAPDTANNFIFLSCNGFYDGVIFHRIVPGFMIQGGDPTGTGTGGPGYEFNDEKVARAYQIGDLAMANSGPNTNGSQFFIMQGPQGTSLPPSYNLFGHVTAGQSVVDAIAKAPAHMLAGGVDTTPSAPDQPVHIQAITVQVS
jgi:cyclophilin family peptidyl-prolyl cis-trans isomerase